MGKKISVIVPCYNVENYIDRCITSLLKQSIGLEHMELIFINDASEDHTIDILKEYEKQYPEDIMIIDLPENQRQGGARNIGLQYASGEYIGFVDADDWIEPSMYEKLFHKITEYSCDMVTCHYKRVDKEEEMGTTGRHNQYFVVDTQIKRKELLVNGMAGGVVCKLIRKNIILNNQIFFPEKLTYEDNLWMSMLYLYINSYYVLEEYLYNYFRNTDSTILSKNSAHHLDRLTIELMKLEEYEARGFNDVFCKEIEFNFVKNYYVNTMHTLLLRFHSIPLDIIKKMQETVKRLFPDYKLNEYNNKNNKIDLILFKTIDLQLDEYSIQVFAENYRKLFVNI